MVDFPAILFGSQQDKGILDGQNSHDSVTV